MKRSIQIFILALLLVSSNVFALDVSIDGNGNITTGTSNSGNLEVTGSSGENAIVGLTDGTGAAGVRGENITYGNYGKLGDYDYGVYGYSFDGYAGYFSGNTRITGNLIVDGSITGETDPTVNLSVKDGVDWTELTGIPVGFADGIDDTSGSSLWTRSGSDIYYNVGNVGIGTNTPAGKLDINGTLCVGGVCRTTWPAGSGTGAFTDSGTTAHYLGGNVGIGTTNPQGDPRVDSSRILHLVHPPQAAAGNTAAAGLRLEIDSIIDAGIISAYETGADGGLFVGTLSNHRVGLGTNGTEKMTIASDGQVGIGTPSPVQKLHVNGNAYISDYLGVGIDSPVHNLQVSGVSSLMSSSIGDFRLFMSKNLAADHLSLVFQENFTGYAEMGLTGDNDFHIKMSSDGAAFFDAFMIDRTNGNIGIGTMVPKGKLNVQSTDWAAIFAENTGTQPSIYALKFGSGDAVYIQKRVGSGNALVIEQRGSDPALLIKTAFSDLMVVESTGNVGIGTSTPQGTLDVNGPIYQRGGVLHADYVFEPDYKLESIEEHTAFMWRNKHLKAMPKAAIDNRGQEIVEVGSHRRGIVEELEKAHIYIDQLQRQIKEQQDTLKLLEERLAKIEGKH